MVDQEKLAFIQLVVFDFDGVFTDNTVYVDQNGIGVFLYFNHSQIKTMFFNRDYWDIIQNVFNLYDYEITPIIRTWLKETYNIPGFKDISTPSPKTFPYF